MLLVEHTQVRKLDAFLVSSPRTGHAVDLHQITAICCESNCLLIHLQHGITRTQITDKIIVMHY